MNSRVVARSPGVHGLRCLERTRIRTSNRSAWVGVRPLIVALHVSPDAFSSSKEMDYLCYDRGSHAWAPQAYQIRMCPVELQSQDGSPLEENPWTMGSKRKQSTCTINLRMLTQSSDGRPGPQFHLRYSLCMTSGSKRRKFHGGNSAFYDGTFLSQSNSIACNTTRSI